MLDYFRIAANVLFRFSKAVFDLVLFSVFVVQLTVRDLIYTVTNPFLPSRRVGNVIPRGYPGHGGTWPEYTAPKRGEDSRSPCPGLNALANHGILPNNGKRITYTQLSHAIQHAYNLAPTLASQLTSAAKQLDQGRGWIDLHDLNVLNVVQHDASFTRPDIAFCPDQSYPHTDLVERLLDHASDGKHLSLADFSYYSGLRRAECKRSNGQYTLSGSFVHKMIGSGTSALMYSIFGGNIEALRVWLVDERFMDGWEPRNREALGHTIAQALATSLAVEFSIDEKQALRTGDVFYHK
ncbi:hypothetical protein AbraIFM66950_004346 [Aspergillus brasiliensis]|nr:hypothetical protein AbraIFM66950_004346 [Aspergillus brasiliensis]